MKRAAAAAQRQSGRSSGVEHNLAKVGVEGSNPFARSRLFMSACAFPTDVAVPRPGGLRCLAAMTKSDAEMLMERETRVSYGPIDFEAFGYVVEPGRSHVEADRYLLRTTDGLSYFYRKGEGITIFRGPDADISEELLWLNGSVYSAVACINGLVPIHASSVAHEGKVFAFTGPSGSGKSTLIAALGKLGLPMFCDDTLVLDLSDADRITCLPGHKRLKLTPEALELTGAERAEKVGQDIDKYYARAPAGAAANSLPLAELIFLEEGTGIAIEPIAGSERFLRAQDDHYTSKLFVAARQLDRAGQFAHRARLAGQVSMARFTRPWDRTLFHSGVGLAARHIGAVEKAD